jgi:hypothetical protein
MAPTAAITTQAIANRIHHGRWGGTKMSIGSMLVPVAADLVVVVMSSVFRRAAVVPLDLCHIVMGQ